MEKAASLLLNSIQGELQAHSKGKDDTDFFLGDRKYF